MPSIDFYSGSKKKKSRGGGAIRNPKKNQVLTFIVASGKPLKGGAILIPKKVDPPNLKTWIRLWLIIWKVELHAPVKAWHPRFGSLAGE